MVPIMYFMFFMPAFVEHFFRDAFDDLLLHAPVPSLEANQRDHHFRNHLDALLGHLHGGFEDGARLHFRDLGMDDAQAAAAEAQHRD